MYSYATWHIRKVMTRGGHIASKSGNITDRFYDTDGTGVLDLGKGTPQNHYWLGRRHMLNGISNLHGK